MTAPTSFPLPLPATSRLRWTVLLGLSLLLHWWALTGIEIPNGPLFAPPESSPTEVKLVAAPPMPPAPPKPAMRPGPPARPAPKAAPVVPPSPLPQQADEALAPAAEFASAPPESTELPAADEIAGAVAEAAGEPLLAEGPQYLTAPLPSAVLKYDVQALRNGNAVYGSGKIRWQTDGQTYTIHGEASVLFFTLLDFQSRGAIDEHGISPTLYTQKRFRKAATNTHFHRERDVISFSASTLSYPRQGGEQDRASLIWQLAAIGRADASLFTPGKDITLLVAGVRDLQSWHMKIAEQEEIETGAGKFMAWRVTHTPPSGSYEQRLDMWFAPELGWYPVKLRHTDYNGEYLDMILSGLEAAPAE